MADDAELLRRYALDRSQDAFAELVSRHLDFVYAVAYRRVGGDANIAQEVSQSVFLALAAKAAALADRPVLTGWLHTATRLEAIQTVRREQRRLQREQTAHSMLELNRDSASADDWHRLRQVIDDAIGELNDRDREAVLMRFFEERPFSEIGARLRITEDGARLRLDRALDKLSVLLAKRGVTSTAAALSVALAQQTGVAAPAGLGATIASAAAALSGAAGPAAIYGAAKTIAMTTIQKTVIASALALTVGAGLFEAGVVYRNASQLDKLQQDSNGLQSQIRHLRDERDAAAGRLNTVEKQIDARLASAAPPAVGSDAALELQMKAWLANLDRMKELLAQRPSLGIPELRLLSESSWFDIAAGTKFDSDEAVRRAFASLRSRAENLMANKLRSALSAYVKANDGLLPDQPGQLLPFFDPPVEAELVERYQMLQTGKLSDLSQSDAGMRLMTVKSPTDIEYDTIWSFGINGGLVMNAMSYNVSEARKEFAKANNGQKATTAEQLLPFLKWPVDAVALEKYLHPPSATTGGVR